MKPPKELDDIRAECAKATKRYTQKELRAMSDFDRMVTIPSDRRYFYAIAHKYVVVLLAYIDKLERHAESAIPIRSAKRPK